MMDSRSNYIKSGAPSVKQDVFTMNEVAIQFIRIHYDL